MKIQYRVGDFLDGSVKVVVHGCNAQGVMGKGAALAVKNRFPFAYRAYMEASKKNKLQVGNIVWAIDINRLPQIIGNMITQEYWQADRSINGRNVSYEAIRDCMKRVENFVQESQNGNLEIDDIGIINEVGMPMIGAGLGGGDWSIISKIIEEESKSFQPIIFKLS